MYRFASAENSKEGTFKLILLRSKMHAIRFFVFLLTILLHIADSVAQTVQVLDSLRGRPLHMVTLSSQTPAAFAVTNAQGKADVSAFAPSGNITVRMLGHATRELSFQQMKESGFIVRMQRESMRLGQAVAVATRWESPLDELPGHFAVITPREAALRQPQTTADLLEASGQVFMQKSQQGGGSPMIRGFATNRILIAVDGVRMNNAIFRSGNLQNVISIDPLALERTEVLFGPGSVMYGSDAIGGVMSFTTLAPQLSTTDSTLVSGSSTGRWSSANGEFTGHLDVKVGRRTWAMLTSITHSDFGDLRMGRHGPDDYLRPTFVQRQDSIDMVMRNDDPLVQRPSAYAQTNLMQKLRFMPAKGWDIQYGFHYSTTGDYARYDRHLRTRNGQPRSARWDYGPQIWIMNTLAVGHTDTTRIYDRMIMRAAHQRFHESRMDRNLNSPAQTTTAEQVDAYSLNIDLKKGFGQRHELLYGLEGVFNDIRSTGKREDIITGETVTAPARYPRSDWTSIGAYGTYLFKTNEKLTLQAGMRYNHFVLNATFDTTAFPLPFAEAHLNSGALTGSLGTLWRPTQRWAISLNLSTGFRSPNVDDLGKVFDSEPGAVTVPNPALQAEYAYNAELSVARSFGHWLKLDVTGYVTYLDNALVRRDFTVNGEDSIPYAGQLSRVQAIQNAAFALVYGLQAGLEVMLPKGFGISGRFNWQHGTEETDDGSVSALRHAGPWFGSAHLTYTHRRLRIDLYAVANGAMQFEDLALEERNKPELYVRDGNGNPHTPAWYTLNLKAAVEVHRHVTISGGVENITDQRYRPYSSGMAAAGLNFVLAVRGHF
jgi:hemoglobin/transferrin/lactoferrin receptor protein